MSVELELRVVSPGNDEYVDVAWRLKERIRRRDGVLKQRKGFFTDAYRRAQVHAYFIDDRLVGFASTRRDGYLLFLAVAHDFRGEGLGKRLIAQVADEHHAVTCHARTTNADALAFYDHLGFEIERRITGYYEDGGDAYYLKLGETRSLVDRLSEFVRG
ncbi:GNAT family N-acetyltransferase [Halobacteriales archaeon SW_7_68_16]|nr:MAG: GNAT family N-acetyltransferase [Halobacteriales archaeon SW_7_68_16]